MQPDWRWVHQHVATLFQSSSGQKAGCNPLGGNHNAGLLLFQSSSGQKAGCNREGRPCCPHRRRVSILIRPEGRMQHGAGYTVQPGARVSILIRPEGRMQQLVSRQNAGRLRFQSSSGQKAGCNTGLAKKCCHGDRVSILIRPEGRMQPQTAPQTRPETLPVSILIRPEGRMQPAAPACGRGAARGSFNPHPARRPDATPRPCPR